MADDLKPILDRLASELKTWLDSPSETSTKLEEMKKQIEAMKNELGAENINTALKALESGDSQIRRQRQKHAAEAIADMMRPLGIRLKPESPPKSQRRRRPSKPNGKPATSTQEKRSAAVQAPGSDAQTDAANQAR